jgi:hypothetical protein
MVLKVSKFGKNLSVLMSRCGYVRAHGSGGEEAFVQRIHGTPYPRFHLYVEEREEEWIFKLHLDQKRPSYEGVRAHSGEHDGPAVEREMERIRALVV